MATFRNDLGETIEPVGICGFHLVSITVHCDNRLDEILVIVDVMGKIQNTISDA